MHNAPIIPSTDAISTPTATPYVHKVTRKERALAKHWFQSAVPYGITEVDWELWKGAWNDPYNAPTLNVSSIERDECVYVLVAPTVAGSKHWSIWFIDVDSAWIDWGSYLTLEAALNRVRPCLNETG